MTRAFLPALLALWASVAQGEPAHAAKHVLYLEFARGGARAADSVCRAGEAPPFRCGRAGCERALLAEVKRLYADFDVDVVLTPPAGPHLTVVISSAGGEWCNPDYGPRVRGMAPLNCAGDARWGSTAYVFACRDVQACAVRIAQESAHLVGLEHTADPEDVMYPLETGHKPRFQSHEMATLNPRCGKASQDSHALLSERLGVRGAHTR